MVDELSAASIGQEFVKEYYHVLITKPYMLYRYSIVSFVIQFLKRFNVCSGVVAGEGSKGSNGRQVQHPRGVQGRNQRSSRITLANVRDVFFAPPGILWQNITCWRANSIVCMIM